MPPGETHIPREATLVVAASDALTPSADYICDGVNDQDEILTAFTALPATGGEVTLLDGTYLLSANLLLENKNDVTLRGQGSSTILKVIDEVSSTLNANANAGQPDVVVNDTTGFIVGQDVFLGATAGGAGAGAGFQRWVAPGGESLIIQSITPGAPGTLTMTCNLTNAYVIGDPIWTIFDAMRIVECHRFKLLNLAVDGNEVNQTLCDHDIFQNLVRFRESDDVEVASCYIKNAVFNSVMLHPGTSLRAKVHDNYLETAQNGAGTRFIAFESNSNNGVVSGNEMKGGYDGVYTAGSDNLSIIGNVIRDAAADGVNVVGDNCTVVGNSLVSCARGVKVYLHDHCTVSGNLMVGCDVGIEIRDADYNIAEGNIVLLSEGMGIDLYGASYCRVLQNLVKDSSQSAHGGSAGINLRNHGGILSEYNFIEHNSVISTTGNKQSYGIRTDDQGGNAIRFNYIEGWCTAATRILNSSCIVYEGHTDHFMDVIVEAANHVASCAGTGAEQTITPASGCWNAQPDVPRNLTVSAAGGAPTGDIVVTGIDARGNTVTETIAITPAGTTVGVIAFATITQFVIPAAVLAATTIDVGIGSILGLANLIYDTADVYKCTKNTADYSGAANITPDATYNTVDVSTGGAIGAGDDFTIWYKTNLNVIA